MDGNFMPLTRPAPPRPYWIEVFSGCITRMSILPWMSASQRWHNRNCQSIVLIMFWSLGMLCWINIFRAPLIKALSSSLCWGQSEFFILERCAQSGILSLAGVLSPCVSCLFSVVLERYYLRIDLIQFVAGAEERRNQLYLMSVKEFKGLLSFQESFS